MHYCHLSHLVRDASLQLPYRNYREGTENKKTRIPVLEEHRVSLRGREVKNLASECK